MSTRKTKPRLALQKSLQGQEANNEVLTEPRVLVYGLSMNDDGYEYRPAKTSPELTDIRVQMPIKGTDLIVHVGVKCDGTVNVAYRKARFADDYMFTDLYEHNVKAEITMKRLAK
jgi:hypothetical protein